MKNNTAKPKLLTFEDTQAWKDSHQAALQIYQLVKKIPKNELYGLISQVCHAAVSIPANIAEGFYRNTTKELLNFLYISRGSCGEVIYYIILFKDLKYITQNEYFQLKKIYDGIARQLNGWIKSLKR